MAYKIKYLIRRYLPSIILISLFIVWPTYRFLSNNLVVLPSYKFFIENRDRKRALMWAKQDSILIADSLKRAMGVPQNNEAAQINSAANGEEEILNGGDTGKMYHIIIGSFVNPEYAKQSSEQYRSQGYPTTIINTTNIFGARVNLVSVKSFITHEEAARSLRDFQVEVESTAWIYPEK